MNYQEIDEDILTLTGTKEWKTLVSLLEAENAAATQNQLEAMDWDMVNYQKGYREALLFVFNVRETTKTLIEQADA